MKNKGLVIFRMFLKLVDLIVIKKVFKIKLKNKFKKHRIYTSL